MKRFFSASTRRMVMMAVYLAVLPPLALGFYSSVQRFDEVRSDVERRGTRAVASIAGRQELITENALAILSALQSAALVRESAASSSAGLFRNIASDYPLFDNIFLLSASGELISSGLPVTGPGDPPWPGLLNIAKGDGGPIARALKTSPFTGLPVMHVLVPLSSGSGPQRGYLGAELELRFFDSVFAGQPIPPGAIVHILSGSGRLLVSSTPSPSVRTGEYIGDSLWSLLEEQQDDSGSIRYPSPDGAYTFAVYKRLRLERERSPYGCVVLTMPERAAMQRPYFFLQRDIMLLLSAGVFAVLVGSALCYAGFSRPIRRLLDVSARLSRGEQGARVTGLERLSGEYKELAEELNAMAEALEAHSQELEREREAAVRSSKAKSEFLANMSHEIRTPMNGILGMAHLVANSNISEAQQAQVAKIHSAAEELLRLINNILDFSRIEAGKMPVESLPFHLGFLLKTVRGSGMEAAKKAGTRLISNIPAEMPVRLIGDPSRIGQATSILLAEALRRCEGRPVEIGGIVAENTGREATLWFTKTVHGVFLPAEELEHLEGLLEGRAGEAAHLNNSELSLMLAGSIMRLLGGKALAENIAEGFRLSAVLRLPIGRSARARDEHMFDGERILFIHNEKEKRAALRALLGRYGLNSTTASSIKEALELTRQAESETPYTLVIVDEHSCVAGGMPLSVFKEGARPPMVVLVEHESRDESSHIPDECRADAVFPYPSNEALLFSLLALLPGVSRESDGKPAQAEQRDDLGKRRFDGLKVLLVEDNLINQEIGKEILAGWGITVSVASSGEEAIECCGQAPGSFDLVLMDLEMPGMGGLAATRALRREKGFAPWRLPIIAMTAHNGADDVAACLEAGMNEHTIKPIMIDQLAAVITRWQPCGAVPGKEALAAVRGLSAILERSSLDDPGIPGFLQTLAPLLRRGRLEMLKGFIIRQEISDALRMLADTFPENSAAGTPGRTGGEGEEHV